MPSEDSETEEKRMKNKLKVDPMRECQDGYSKVQILVHNIPLLIMYGLGTTILGFFNLIFAIIFLIYLLISNYIFMITICAYCPHYGSRSAICGYGLITSKLTDKKRPKDFKAQFKRYIAVLFPNWFLPLIIGIYLVISSINWYIILLLIIFSIDAFGVVLYVSRSKSCKTCKLKGACPWSSICGN